MSCSAGIDVGHHLALAAPAQHAPWIDREIAKPTSACTWKVRCTSRTPSTCRRVEGGGEPVERGPRAVQPERIAVDHEERVRTQQVERRLARRRRFPAALPRAAGWCAAVGSRGARRWAATSSACQCALTTTVSTPAAASRSSAWSSSGRPPSGSSGLAVRSVSGRMRVPRPAASSIAVRGRAVMRRGPAGCSDGAGGIQRSSAAASGAAAGCAHAPVPAAARCAGRSAGSRGGHRAGRGAPIGRRRADGVARRRRHRRRGRLRGSSSGRAAR